MRLILGLQCLTYVLVSFCNHGDARGIPSQPWADTHSSDTASTRLEKRAGPLGAGLLASVLNDNWVNNNERNTIQNPARLNPLPQSEQQIADAGEPDAYDNTEIPGIQPEPQSAAGYWQVNPSSGQMVQKALKLVDQDGHDAIWAEALERGRKLRTDLNHWVGQDLSRLSQSAPSISERYDVEAHDDTPVQSRFTQVDEVFHMAGFRERTDSGFSILSIFSKTALAGVKQDDRKPVLNYAVNGETGTFVSLEAWAQNDGTIHTDRLKSSELLWQSWSQYAARKGVKHEEMRVFLRHHIVNQETNNLMTLAHMRFPDMIKNIPFDKNGILLPPTAGHGIWYPDEDEITPEGDVYLRLLNSPNVKSVVHMIADHCNEMLSPYITAIHTFPAVKPGIGVDPRDARWSHMVLVLGEPVEGPKELPVQALDGSATSKM